MAAGKAVSLRYVRAIKRNMRTNFKKIDVKKDYPYIIYFLVFIFSEAMILLSPSEKESAWIFGVSKLRIGMAVCTAICAWLVIFLLQDIEKKEQKTFYAQITGCVLLSFSFVVLLTWFFDTENTIFSVMGNRGWPVFVFAGISGIVLLVEAGKSVARSYDGPDLRKEILILLSLLIVSATAGYYDSISFEKNFSGIFAVTAVFFVLITVYSLFKEKENVSKDLIVFLQAAVIASCAFYLIRITQMYVGRVNTPSSAYWGELADAFAHGRLYLENPSGFHDLTFFDRHWYVPNPPLPAILLLPYALITRNASQLNTSIYSAIIGAINAGILYLTLKETVKKGLFELSDSGIVWLTIAVVLGSDMETAKAESETTMTHLRVWLF